MADTPSIAPGESLLLETVSTTGAGKQFTFPMNPDGSEFSVVFQADSGTTISADLQINLGGGFVNYSATLITAAGAKALPASGTTPAVAGALFRFNYTTLTGTWNIRLCRN